MFDGAGPFANRQNDRFHFGPVANRPKSDEFWPDPDALDNRPSLLIINAADTKAEFSAEVAAMASGAGFRIVGTILPEVVAQRLALTVGVDAVLIDLRGLSGNDSRLPPLLTTLLSWPGWHDVTPLLLADIDAVDRVAALLPIPFDRMLCDPALSDIGSELCLLAHESRQHALYPARLSDIGRDTDAARLEQLSAEVRRLAQTIDRLVRDGRSDSQGILKDRGTSYAPPPSGKTIEDRPAATREEVRAILHARRMRERFLPGDLFADPAWDMMLDLLAARIDGKRVSVSSLCIASAVPPTTALRWIAQLTDRGIFERCSDPDDARRVFIALSDEAAGKLSGWFAATRQTGLHFTA